MVGKFFIHSSVLGTKFYEDQPALQNAMNQFDFFRYYHHSGTGWHPLVEKVLAGFIPEREFFSPARGDFKKFATHRATQCNLVKRPTRVKKDDPLWPENIDFKCHYKFTEIPMKVYYCEVPHNPPFTYGDCIRACLATLLDDPDMPHFHDKRAKTPQGSVLAWGAVREYLRVTHGRKLALFPYESDELKDVLKFMKTNNDYCYYMLLCRTIAGDHAVVCKGDQVIHDPAGDSLIVGPHSNGLWSIGIINV